MALPDPLTHLNQHGERNLDTVTLQHLLKGAQRALGMNVAVLALYADDDEAGRAEWIALTKEEDDANVEAVLRIRAELQRRESEA